ncbi:MAG: tryptophan--tRNA ligase [Nanoarchaeota archaeon]|jgi:tryptophanyl-tRNA synthetase|nr:tryptophan--tRNA ligase [Nanoarchaeota archaeon]
MVDKFSPWEIEGDLNYAKLIKDFGIEPMKVLPEVFQEEVLFRRGVVFGNRDFGRILTAVKEKKKFVMMTGLMPTGRFHIGHMLLLKQVIFWQKMGAKIYIAVADIEAYNARGQSFVESKKIARDYLLDYDALGLDLNKCEIYFQSERGIDAKKSNAYYRLQNQLAGHVTFNEFKGAYGEVTPGKMLAALLQGSDMLHPQLKEFEGSCPVLIPVGIDQDPHIRLTRDITKRVKEYKFIPISSTYHLFMPGLTGGKMSASDANSHIAMTDTAAQIKKKIGSAFSGGQETVEEHRKLGGNPDVDVAFQYLKFFFEEDDQKLAEVESAYRSGEMLSGEVKKMLIEKVQVFLADHQEKRTKAEKVVDKFLYKVKN